MTTDKTTAHYLCTAMLADLPAQAIAVMLPRMLQAFQAGQVSPDPDCDMQVPHIWEAIGPEEVSSQWVCCGCNKVVESDDKRSGGVCKTATTFNLIIELIETTRKLHVAQDRISMLESGAAAKRAHSAKSAPPDARREAYAALVNLDHQAFLYAACLSIAEGAPGWQDPIEGEGPAHQAVRKVRALANALEKVFPSDQRSLVEAVDRVNDLVLCEAEWRELIDFVGRKATSMRDVAIPDEGDAPGE